VFSRKTAKQKKLEAAKKSLPRLPFDVDKRKKIVKRFKAAVQSSSSNNSSDYSSSSWKIIDYPKKKNVKNKKNKNFLYFLYKIPSPDFFILVTLVTI